MKKNITKEIYIQALRWIQTKLKKFKYKQEKDKENKVKPNLELRWRQLKHDKQQNTFKDSKKTYSNLTMN